MDSGNSGSMQSSSGGDEEYDSRAETISGFLNPPPPHQPAQQQPHHHHHQQNHDSMFDPFSNYFDTSSRSSNPNSLLNLDMVWPKNLRSEPDLGGAFMAASCSSSASSSTQQLFTNQAVLPPARANTFSPLHSLPHHHHQTESVSGFNIDKANPIITTSSGGGGGGGNNNLTRNPKKRSRASRRAPTTVLTTDTSNFRAMVQEFTGIPAPPFTSSPFPRTRLDLFGSSTSLRSSSHLDPSPPYLLRPFAQKFHTLPPFVSLPSSTPSTSSPSASMIDAIAAASTSTNPTSATPSNNNNNANINYQNLLNMNNSAMQNPILNLQSLLQPQAKFPLSNSPLLANKPQGSSSALDNMNHHHPSNEESHLKLGVLEELGLSGHGHLNTNLNSGGLQNIVSSTPTFENDQAAAAAGTANESDQHQGLLNSPTFSGGNNYNNNSSHHRVPNGKGNTFSASSSDFHRDKVQENVGTRTRTEGMVESWICSSD